jgi:hypothetical protein
MALSCLMSRKIKEDNVMNVNVNVNRKYKINGKEYNSIEEMPPDIRNAFEKAMASQAGSGIPITTHTKIIFNGTEYQSIDAMPQDVYQLYEKVLKAAETGSAPANVITAGDISGISAEHKTYGNTNIGNMGSPAKIEPTAFSTKTLVRGIALIILIIFLYYFVFQGR